MTTQSQSAFDTIKNEYDIDTLREINEYGCSSGIANNHIYYSQTVSFFDKHEDEILEYIDDTLGESIMEEIWNNNTNHINGYKNDTVWCYIELVASQIVSEYEDITCEEMNDSFDEVLNSDFGLINQLNQLNPELDIVTL